MHQLPELMAQATHTAFYLLMWSVSLLLQLTLFVSLFSRGVARVAPFFTNFVGFYLLRSALLFLLLNYISVPSYSWLYHLGLFLDIFVELGVALELTLHLVRAHGGWTPRNIIIPIIFLCAAAVGTYLTMRLTPENLMPVDQPILFFSYDMLLLWGWSFFVRESSVVVRSISQGFAIYSTINIIANIGRNAALFYDHPQRYSAWTYVLAASYMVVVIFWLGTLWPNPEKIAPKPLGTTI